ncbi:MAG: hypothetical protein KDB80_15920 [Planctomycetes bacterium]|nr:hypothetical protein [Planctomycetota bacterium]
MERTRPSRRSRKNLGRLARVWRILLTPILHLLRKYREEYARRRRRVGRLVERVGEAVLAPDDTVWALRRWTHLMRWLTLRHGSAADHFAIAA